MNYFRKTKFRESSLIIVALFVAIIYFTTNTISYEQSKEVQELIDKRVEEALKEATTTTLPNNTTTTTTTTTTNPYPNQYDRILIGYVTDVRLNDRGKVNEILISEMLWTDPGSSVQLYRNNRTIDEWDFKIGDHVVAVLVGPMLISYPGYQAASRIYIINEIKIEPLPDN
jgi:hypothetical protein